MRGTGKPDGKSGRRKGGVKVHTVINAEEGVPCLVRFSKAARSDGKYMHLVRRLPKGSIVAMDRGYCEHGELEKIGKAGIFYVTRLKDNVNYEVMETLSMSAGLAGQEGVLSDEKIAVSYGKNGREKHACRRIGYMGTVKDRNGKESLREFVFLTNNTELQALSIAKIYRNRWQIELLFKRIKQNFPLKYFYGESKNAIVSQIWVVLIACLLLTIVHRTASKRRKMAFSNLIAVVRTLLMSYIGLYAFLENPDKAWEEMKSRQNAHPEPNLFSQN